MDSMDVIKKKMAFLFRTHPQVHVNVALKRPKTVLTNLPVVIRGVYPHVFQLEYSGAGKNRIYIHQYNAIVTGEIEIPELEAVCPVTSA